MSREINTKVGRGTHFGREIIKQLDRRGLNLITNQNRIGQDLNWAGEDTILLKISTELGRSGQWTQIGQKIST